MAKLASADRYQGKTECQSGAPRDGCRPEWRSVGNRHDDCSQNDGCNTLDSSGLPVSVHRVHGTVNGKTPLPIINQPDDSTAEANLFTYRRDGYGRRLVHVCARQHEKCSKITVPNTAPLWSLMCNKKPAPPFLARSRLFVGYRWFGGSLCPDPDTICRRLTERRCVHTLHPYTAYKHSLCVTASVCQQAANLIPNSYR